MRKYVELSRVMLTENRDIVISKCGEDGYTIAQQYLVNDGNEKLAVFLKGALHIKNENVLKELRDAINVALIRTGKVNN